MTTIPTCCVSGRIAGDPLACGDCDPCIDGAGSVPEAVKKLIAERDKWADECAGAMEELQEAEKYNGFHQQACLEIERLREALTAIAGFGDVNLASEWEAGLRDIIRSMTDCARTALSADERGPDANEF